MNSVQFAGTIKGTAGLAEIDGKPVHDSLISVTEYEGTTAVETLVCARIIGKRAEGAAKAIRPMMRMVITGRILKGKTSLAGDADFVVECREITLWPAAEKPSKPDPAPAAAPAPEPAAAATPEPVPAEKPAPKGPAQPKAAAAPRGPVAASTSTAPGSNGRPW